MFYYVNDGVYGTLNCVMYDKLNPSPRVLKTVDLAAPTLPSTSWGPTCDALDCIAQHALLPALDIGDWLYFEVSRAAMDPSVVNSHE